MLSLAALGGGAYAVAYARVMLPWQTRKVAEARKLRGDLSVNVERSGELFSVWVARHADARLGGGV